MKLKALRYLRYAGRPVRQGGLFDAKPADVRILVAIGHAEVAPPPPAPPAPPRARQIKEDPPPVLPPVYYAPLVPFDPVVEDQAEPAPKPAAAEQPPKARRTYSRRDLVADE